MKASRIPTSSRLLEAVYFISIRTCIAQLLDFEKYIKSKINKR
jgi:hypothetical protein